MRLFIFLILVTQLSFAQEFFRFSKGGGGGHHLEAKVNQIRSEILSWINKGGSSHLKLPYGLTVDTYNSRMQQALKKSAVKIVFLSDKKSIQVDGQDKVCKNFYANNNGQPTITCNANDFENLSPTDRFLLIHHEYASLVYLERNNSSTSDYEISNQLLNFIIEEEDITLSLREVNNIDGEFRKNLSTKYDQTYVFDTLTPSNIKIINKIIHMMKFPARKMQYSGIVLLIGENDAHKKLLQKYKQIKKNKKSRGITMKPSMEMKTKIDIKSSVVIWIKNENSDRRVINELKLGFNLANSKFSETLLNKENSIMCIGAKKSNVNFILSQDNFKKFNFTLESCLRRAKVMDI